MEFTTQMSGSDEEEDLEALRLAALQSLKKKNETSDNPSENPQTFKDFCNYPVNNQLIRPQKQSLGYKKRLSSNFSVKRGRFFGRGNKNVPFSSSRVRSSNLISITPISIDNEHITELSKNIGNSELNCSEDRLLNKKNDETTSKFDRFNDSDKSDDETEDEIPKSDSEDDGPLKLERSDSLEALMQELDDEIQGKSKIIEKNDVSTKTKTKTKRKKNNVSETENEEDSSEKKNKVEEVEGVIESAPKIQSDLKQDTTKEKSIVDKPQFKKRRHSPPIQREFNTYRVRPRTIQPPPLYQNSTFLPPVSLQYPTANIRLTMPSPNVMFPLVNGPTFYERPLSPLSINADTLQTQTMAPLSPRSAAFVLENRAIIEKRKRSPKRSYSRSPTPRGRSLSPRSPRRSLSPRRLISPRRRSRSPRRRSLTPNRHSPNPKQITLSPRSRPFSPRQRVFSPKRSLSPRKKSLSPRRKKESDDSPKNKTSIRDRLGIKASVKSDNKEGTLSDINTKKEVKPSDSVLEARKKKFENKEILVREGVIRLKPKEEKIDESKKDPEILQTNDSKFTNENESRVNAIPNKEELLGEDSFLQDDELELEPKVDLFSDEDSGSENEGRFKLKEQHGKKPTIPLFTKLINGTVKEVKSLNEEKKNSNNRRRARSRSPHSKKIKNSLTVKKKEPERNIKKITGEPSTRKRVLLKAERHPEPKKFERKIEIKIKNPSKYEKEDKIGLEKERKEKVDRTFRKLEMTDDKRIKEEDDDETEIVVENDDELENSSTTEGDLRAQLSKKRAEKMNKNTSKEGVPSRLLQNALQNALPLKKIKKSKPKELSSSDGKLPIHLRLGVACTSEVFSKSKRKTRKRRQLETEDQV